LDEWCARMGRDPAEIERTVLIEHDDLQVDAYLGAGAQHLIVELGTTGDTPFDLGPVRELLDRR
ncbi:MAG: LLM class F420-dependent oxidoreductase, partial [Actinomycetota bacterium]